MTSARISRITKLVVSPLAFTTAALGISRGEELPPAPSVLNGTRPNIVHILIDDLGWTDLQCMGSDFYETPHIDKLREQGMMFTAAYAGAPVCAPSRASILTGRYPVRTGITDVFMPKKAVRMTKLHDRVTGRNLPPSEVTIAEMLRAAGYATACIGKWHLGGDEGSRPQDSGFDFVGAEMKREEPGDYRAMNRYTRQSMEFIEKNKDRPFYLYLSHTAVHLPYHAPRELIEKYEKKLRPGMNHTLPIYAATIEYLDKKTGELLQKLDEFGLAENTLVIFTSDNGGRASNFDYQLVTRNLPLHGGKHGVYEGGLRVPLIMRWPGRIATNSTCATPVHHVDYMPTFAALAGAETHGLPVLDGVSIAPLLASAPINARPLFWFYPHYNIVTDYGASTLYENMRPVAVILEGGWKLIDWFEDPRTVELYKIDEDIGEKTNMAALMPARVAGLRKKLAHWYDSAGVRLPERRVDYDPDRAFSVLWRWGDKRYEAAAEKYAPKDFPDLSK
jgi:arylsulfatase A-like enzyme